ncbi:hypothetical protein [Piscinibacter sp.]|uniref:hypothetical protein n=1 Tax=Piscinibacter sp. TaxID=1903157 RepID=UPI002C9B9CBB|nr:hypothetical protein [Albitalea sp.]HUG22848.1 hypothetical protein [Albitalea sp.]
MVQLLTGLVLIGIAAVVGFYGTQLAQEGWTKVFQSGPAATRPYVVVAGTQLVRPADPIQPIQVSFDLKNTGQSEALGSLRNFTYFFSINPEQLEFEYQTSEAMTFSLAPAELWQAHFFPNFVLTPEKLRALNAGAARLFLYAQGEYRDSDGRVYSFPFARMYHPTIAGNLAIPPDNIVFRERTGASNRAPTSANK